MARQSALFCSLFAGIVIAGSWERCRQPQLKKLLLRKEQNIKMENDEAPHIIIIIPIYCTFVYICAQSSPTTTVSSLCLCIRVRKRDKRYLSFSFFFFYPSARRFNSHLITHSTGDAACTPQNLKHVTSCV